MIKENTLVLYKNMPAIVTSLIAGGKFSIKYKSSRPDAKKVEFATINVREKDIVCISDKKVSSLENCLKFSDAFAPKIEDMNNLNQSNSLFLSVKEAWELLTSDEETAKSKISFEELSSIIKSDVASDETYGIYLSLKNTLYFVPSQEDFLNGKLFFLPRTNSEIEDLIAKADLKGRELEMRDAFFRRLKSLSLKLPEDGVYMADVESLALGRTDKSRTMHDANMKETPEKAHQLLLDTHIWDITRNPYPIRWGLSMKSATESLSSPPEEERQTVSDEAYAIDNEWSTDPDDAVSFDGEYLWVHIADPASTVKPNSSIDISARNRGATLYIPEGAARMLCEDALSDYALGLSSISRALSFKLKLSSDGSIEDCEVLKTLVKVKRLTYIEADALKDTAELKPLFDIAERNIKRRTERGAVQISMPEVHIIVDERKKVSIVPQTSPKSSEMVREMMLLAGEGAARFAFKNDIPFPFVSQEAPSLPDDIPEGLSGQYKLRRCMHKRSVGITPAPHAGLGLSMYSQVTSPLRRYGDLIAHMQLRAFLAGQPLLDKDTMLFRVAEGEASAQAAHKAERKSNTHWTLVYLLQNPDWTGEAICVDTNGKLPLFSIPSLAMEAYIPASPVPSLNEAIKIRAGRINLPELTVDFIPL